MRDDWREHQDQKLENSLGNLGPDIFVEGFLRLYFIQELHDKSDGTVEMPAGFEVVRHAFERLLSLAKQQLFLRRRMRQINGLSGICRDAAQFFGMAVHQTVDLVQETRTTLDSLLAP